jgi:diazepam-binding inhibitor (GABA receptor modulating acyl-CoA-binding protein)
VCLPSLPLLGHSQVAARQNEQLRGCWEREIHQMQAFQDAARRATALPPQPDAVKLSLYAFYKQATVGNAPSQSPSAWDVVARAKWEAWGGVQGMDAERAQAEYVSLVNIREAAAGPPPIAADAPRSSSGSRRPKASRDNCGFIMCLTRVASCDFGRDDEERSPLKEPQKLLVSSPPQTGKKFCCLGC